MSVKKFYETLEIDPTDVLYRFGNNEMMLEKFLKKFQSDQTFQALEMAMKEKNWDDIFRNAHTLKGLCGNFDFKILYDYSAKMVERYRAQDFDAIPPLFEKFKARYQFVLSALNQYFS